MYQVKVTVVFENKEINFGGDVRVFNLFDEACSWISYLVENDIMPKTVRMEIIR